MSRRTDFPAVAALAKWHGAGNIAAGLWPLLHMKSFEAVLGPKTDARRARTVWTDRGLDRDHGETKVTPRSAWP